MRKILTIALLTAGLVASAQATLTTGVEVGYLVDSEEAYTSVHLGKELSSSQTLSHQLEFEAAYFRLSAPYYYSSTRVTPFTVNYRGLFSTSDKLDIYYGIGAGVAFVNRGGNNDHSETFQFFTGLNYKIGTASSFTLGVKYLKIGDNYYVSGDDAAITAGLSFKF